MGSPDFAVPSLRALAVAADFRVLGVVTQPDRPAGRGGKMASPPVKQLAQELGLPVLQPDKLRSPAAIEQLRLWAPDLIVVAAFGQILRQDVLDLPPFGCINVHASVLPRWRGAAPIQAAILAGDPQTGVTIMKMDAGIDTGPTLAQSAIPVLPTDTAGSLFEKLAGLGADLLLATLPGYLAGALQPQPQPDEGATYASMLKKEDGNLDFTRPAAELERKVRAFNPWPGAFLSWDKALLKVLAAHALDDPGAARADPGKRLIYERNPAVATGDGLLVLDEVQPPGKRSMPGKAFLAGARNWKS
jgi:methionyl-tRNA formyltransferase